jgi:hypothetical protein
MSRKLSPAHKRDLVLSYPGVIRTGPNSYTRLGEESYPRRLHAMYSLLYPKQFLTIRALPDWRGYRMEYHEIGIAPSFRGAPRGWEVGIACPLQAVECDWALPLAKLVANIVEKNTARLEEISPCVCAHVLAYKGADQAVLYIPDAWSREYKESLFAEFAEYNAWLAERYTELAAAYEANPKCTSLQVQQQLDIAATLGGLRPELAAQWQAHGDARLP